MKVKTRLELANEYGISRKTLYNWLKKEKIKLPARLLGPKDVEKIYKVYGAPDRNFFLKDDNQSS